MLHLTLCSSMLFSFLISQSFVTLLTTRLVINIERIQKHFQLFLVSVVAFSVLKVLCTNIMKWNFLGSVRFLIVPLRIKWRWLTIVMIYISAQNTARSFAYVWAQFHLHPVRLRTYEPYLVFIFYYFIFSIIICATLSSWVLFHKLLYAWVPYSWRRRHHLRLFEFCW